MYQKMWNKKDSKLTTQNDIIRGHVQGIKTVHAGGGVGVKQWQNSIRVSSCWMTPYILVSSLLAHQSQSVRYVPRLLIIRSCTFVDSRQLQFFCNGVGGKVISIWSFVWWLCILWESTMGWYNFSRIIFINAPPEFISVHCENWEPGDQFEFCRILAKCSWSLHRP